MARQSPPRRATPFRPRFLLLLLYLAASFMIFALILVLPEMLHVLRTVPAGPEQQERARDLVHAAAAGTRIRIAFAAAVALVGLGAWTGTLPGLRRR
jgi:hypothetical protein